MSKYVDGAKNLLDSLEINEDDGLIILSMEKVQDFARYVLSAAKEKGYRNIINVNVPDNFRPVTQIPDLLSHAVENTKGLVYLVDRRAEENFTFNRPLQELCVRNRCRYIYAYDPKLDYLEQGIAADYNVVAEKAKKIKKIMENSKEVRVTSPLGTDLRFQLYTHNIIPRSPIFNEGLYWNQAPEGEVMSCPYEKSFNGRMVIDGVVTGMGEPPSPITWDFKDGIVTNLEGDTEFLDKLFSMLHTSDRRLESFIGMYIAELSIGCNDWAVFDDNISNCEKVSGGVHFAMGNSEGLGEDRGETYHFDNIMKSLTLTITAKDNNSIKIIEDGELVVE